MLVRNNSHSLESWGAPYLHKVDAIYIFYANFRSLKNLG